MLKRIFVSAVAMLFAVAFAFGAFLSQVRAQEATADLRNLTTREYQAPDLGYRFDYELNHYSVRQGCACALPGGSDILFPGVITVEPNDSLVYRDAQGTIYEMSIAAVGAPEGRFLDAKLFGTGPLTRYTMDVFDPDDAYEIDLGGVRALRLDDVPIGPNGISDIIAFKTGLLYEILIVPVNGEPSESMDAGRLMLEDMLASFEFAGSGA
jgi:hypothetical protein